MTLQKDYALYRLSSKKDSCTYENFLLFHSKSQTVSLCSQWHKGSSGMPPLLLKAFFSFTQFIWSFCLSPWCFQSEVCKLGRQSGYKMHPNYQHSLYAGVSGLKAGNVLWHHSHTEVSSSAKWLQILLQGLTITPPV